mgnify:CR=1 FL=1
MSYPPDWQRLPTPPPEQNGWGRYVAATLANLQARVWFLERSHDELKSSHHASDAPTTSPPKDGWSDKKDFVKELGSVTKDLRTSLMWIAAIILLLGLIFKKIDPSQLPTLKSWLGTGA